MTNTKELVERLRAGANGLDDLKSPRGDYGLLDDAADAILALESSRPPVAGSGADYRIVLVSERLGDAGYQLHGLFANFADALAHAKKDGVRSDSKWNFTSPDRGIIQDGADFWVASQEPIRRALATPEPPAPLQGDHFAGVGNMIERERNTPALEAEAGMVAAIDAVLGLRSEKHPDKRANWFPLGTVYESRIEAATIIVHAVRPALEALRPNAEDVREAERRAVARCIEIARETRDGFLSPGYATDQPLSSFQERFACDQVATAIENEFAIGTIEQCKLLGKPTPFEQFAALPNNTAQEEGKAGNDR